jgi:glycosyltransferase involved in cell wall biosynthesis
MALAQVKEWVKSRSWIQPYLPMLRVVARPWRYLRVVRHCPPVAYLFRTIETGMRLIPVPVRMVPFLWHYRWLQRVGRQRIRVPAAPASRHIVMLVQSDLSVDPRVQREAKALAAAGFSVTVICAAWSADLDNCKKIDWGPGIDFRILPLSAGRFVTRYPHLYGKQLLDAALAENAWAYHAHDLDMALIALLAAAHKEVACVCDFHEWYSENVSYDRWTGRYRPHNFFKRRLYRMMERCAMHSATEVITVCQSIAELLETTFLAPRPVHVIRNIPEVQQLAAGTVACQDLRSRLKIPADRRIVMYQGGMGPSRNLEPVIEAMKYAPGAALVIRGPGYEDFGPVYHQLAKKLKVADRVFCLPPVPSTRVVVEARTADLGLWTLLANVGLNFKFSLPNKVFEYLAAGIPLLVADLPEVGKIVNGHKIGLCFDPVDPHSIAGCINRFVEDPALLASCRENIRRAREELSGEKEWAKLVTLYRNLGEH